MKRVGAFFVDESPRFQGARRSLPLLYCEPLVVHDQDEPSTLSWGRLEKVMRESGSTGMGGSPRAADSPGGAVFGARW